MTKTPLLIASALVLLPLSAFAQDGQSQPQSQSQGGWGNGGNGPRMTPEERFAQMDANKDGFIARDEYKGRRPEMFDQMDADKDGKLSKDEMIAFMKARMNQQGGQRPSGAAASSSSGGK